MVQVVFVYVGKLDDKLPPYDDQFIVTGIAGPAGSCIKPSAVPSISNTHPSVRL